MKKIFILFLLCTFCFGQSYTLKVDIKALSVFTSGTSYWSMRNNTSGNRMFIRNIYLMSEFVGVAATTLSQFGYFRFSGGTPTGGVALTAVITDTTGGASNLLDARFATGGLTMTGVTVEANPLFISTTINQLVSSNVVNPFPRAPFDSESIILNPGEGIVIQAFNTLVAGIGLHGNVLWSEGL